MDETPQTSHTIQVHIPNWIKWMLAVIFIFLAILIYLFYRIDSKPAEADTKNQLLLQQNEALAKENDSINVANIEITGRIKDDSLHVAALNKSKDSLELRMLRGERDKAEIHNNANAKIARIKEIPTEEKALDLLKGK